MATLSAVYLSRTTLAFNSRELTPTHVIPALFDATMASSSTSTSDPVADVRPEAAGEEPTLKRRKNEAEWKKTVAKKKRNSGQEYVGRNTRKIVAARRVGAPCECPKGCFEKLGEEAVQRVFNEYWKMGDFNAQSAYIVNRVKSKEVKTPRVGEGSRRKATLEYSVHVAGESVVVCKKAFLSLHDLSDKRILNVLKKVGDTGVAPVDRRGTHGHTHNRPSEDVKQLGHDHIKSLPLCSSHYSRAKSRHRLYLPPSYTQRHCYSLFQLWCEGKGVPADKVMNFDAYRRLFTTFNIGQSPPKVDTCSTCDRLEIQLEAATAENDEGKKRDIVTQQTLHRARARAAHNLLTAYSELQDDTQVSICMDLQQTLVTPRLSTNEAYYKRKIWTYNFGIHDLTGAVHPVMYVWNETVAKRGSCEIASCLTHYIEHHVPASVSKLTIFSDNCGGQNKNINMCLHFLRLIHSQRFGLVKHYFLMPGHSYMPCDRDFGNLENFFRGREIYTTDHYVELMRDARRESPFTVVEMSSDMFYDLLPLQSLCTKTQIAKSKFKEGRLFVYKSDFKQGMRIHHSYFEDDDHDVGQEVKLQKEKRATYNPEIFDLSTVDLPRKYPDGVALRPDKLADLNHLLRFIPLAYKTWYTDLFASQGLLAAGGVDDDNPDDPELQEDDILDF